MDYKEVVQQLKDHFERHKDTLDTPYLDEAVSIMFSALEKQIPKKPFKYYFYDRYYTVDYFYQCPNHCNDRFQLSNTYSFCPVCGQALDWSGDYATNLNELFINPETR